jgi:hypothetical protein
MNLIFRLLFFLVIADLYGADSFIVPDKPAAKRTRNSLKQDISHMMASLVEQSSILLEKEAQIQQRLCKEVRAALEGTRESKIQKGTLKELEELMAQLQKEFHKRSDYCASQQTFLSSLK